MIYATKILIIIQNYYICQMLKKLICILLLPLTLSCVTDEKLVGGDNKGNNGGDGNEELVYNEPLFLYNKTQGEVKAAEKRNFISETTERLIYEEKKDTVEYQIAYYFSNNAMTAASVLFDYDQALLETLINGLKNKYTMLSEVPIIFDHSEYGKEIRVEYDSSANYISVDY